MGDLTCQGCGAAGVPDRETVRALLCHLCNTALGMMDDDPARFRAAANYLEAHAARIVLHSTYVLGSEVPGHPRPLEGQR